MSLISLIFKIDNSKALDVETDFSYLGLTIDQKGKFFKARAKLIEQAKRASFAVINQEIKKNNLPVDIQLKLFDHMIASILLYGSEIWGYEKLIEQAKRASFAVINQEIKKNNLPVDIQLKLFDHMIASILLYGSEIWGYENCEMIESFPFKYCKQLLHLKASTPKLMVYGELDRYPMQLDIKSRMVSFWSKILCGKKIN